MTTMTLARSEAPAAVVHSTEEQVSIFYAYACKIAFLFFGIILIPVGVVVFAAETAPLFNLYTQSAQDADIGFCFAAAAQFAWAIALVLSFVQAYDYHKHG